MTAEARSGAFLDGITVLDLTTFLSGPFGTQILADMGADIVKVESPEGDSSRAIPPYFLDGDSAYFHAINRNKTSIQLDLKDPRGVELFLQLAARADVVIDNFRPGVTDRLGIGPVRLRQTNAKLVTCSLSGFGVNGPRRDTPAYDAMIQALSGGMSLTGHPGDAPARMGIPIGDLAAGMYAGLGILAALVRRQSTGTGEHIDVAMFDSQLALLVYQAAYHLVSGVVPGPQGAGHMSIPTYRAFRCGDGAWVMVTANTERMWGGLCRVLGLAHLIADERFLTNAQRLAHAPELWEILEPAFLARPSTEVLAGLAEESVPAAPVNTVADALRDEQTMARRMVVELTGRDKPIPVTGNPIKAAGMRPEEDFRSGSRLGEDTSRVVRGLAGLDEDQVRDLQAAGVLGPFPS